MMFQITLLFIAIAVLQCSGFSPKPFPLKKVQTRRIDQTSRLSQVPFTSSFLFSEEIAGLDADTLSALGDVQDIATLDIEAPTNVVGILTQLTASPLILAVPIGGLWEPKRNFLFNKSLYIEGGLLVALGLAFFIVSYGNGRD